jgi:hypothetical protein
MTNWTHAQPPPVRIRISRHKQMKHTERGAGSGPAGGHLLTAAGSFPHTLCDSHLLGLNITTWKAVTPLEMFAWFIFAFSRIIVISTTLTKHYENLKVSIRLLVSFVKLRNEIRFSLMWVVNSESWVSCIFGSVSTLQYEAQTELRYISFLTDHRAKNIHRLGTLMPASDSWFTFQLIHFFFLPLPFSLHAVFDHLSYLISVHKIPPSTRLDPKSSEYSRYLQTLFKIEFSIILPHPRLCPVSVLFPLGFPTKILLHGLPSSSFLIWAVNNA